VLLRFVIEAGAALVALVFSGVITRLIALATKAPVATAEVVSNRRRRERDSEKRRSVMERS